MRGSIDTELLAEDMDGHRPELPMALTHSTLCLTRPESGAETHFIIRLVLEVVKLYVLMKEGVNDTPVCF